MDVTFNFNWETKDEERRYPKLDEEQPIIRKIYSPDSSIEPDTNEPVVVDAPSHNSSIEGDSESNPLKVYTDASEDSDVYSDEVERKSVRDEQIKLYSSVFDVDQDCRAIDDWCVARYGGDEEWSIGTVIAINNDYTFQVRYDPEQGGDDDKWYQYTESNVPMDRMFFIQESKSKKNRKRKREA